MLHKVNYVNLSLVVRRLGFELYRRLAHAAYIMGEAI
jgi:hypothetical protein